VIFFWKFKKQKNIFNQCFFVIVLFEIKSFL
jgi:hypothetical protein